jgi:hypothetical protein
MAFQGLPARDWLFHHQLGANDAYREAIDKGLIN